MTYVEQINYKKYEHKFKEQCCRAPNIIETDGFEVCSNCGTTFSRTYANQINGNYSLYERNKRRQNERVLTPIGPRTVFSVNKDGKGNKLTPDSYGTFKRLAKINRGLRTSIERNLWLALPKFKIIERKLNLPQHISKEAYQIYILSVKKKITLGRGIDNILAASFYAAIKIYGIPRSVEEISQAAQISQKDLIKNVRALNQIILPLINAQLKVVSSNTYLRRFNKELKLPMKCQRKAINLLENCKENGMRTCGKDPKGFAAGALYIISKNIDEPRTQKEICKTSGISEVTLRTRIKEIESFQ